MAGSTQGKGGALWQAVREGASSILLSSTCEMLMKEPLEPAVTILMMLFCAQRAFQVLVKAVTKRRL